jgi:phage terminase small subunit
MTKQGTYPVKTWSAATKAEWDGLKSEYPISDRFGLIQLKMYCDAFEQDIKCQKLLDEEGLQFSYKGRLIEHPAAQTQRGAQTRMRNALKALRLDEVQEKEPPRIGRPPKGIR